jgi:hypothetical protein
MHTQTEFNGQSARFSGAKLVYNEMVPKSNEMASVVRFWDFVLDDVHKVTNRKLLDDRSTNHQAQKAPQ